MTMRGSARPGDLAERRRLRKFIGCCRCKARDAMSQFGVLESFFRRAPQRIKDPKEEDDIKDAQREHRPEESGSLLRLIRFLVDCCCLRHGSPSARDCAICLPWTGDE